MTKESKPDTWMPPKVRPGSTLRVEFDLRQFSIARMRLTCAEAGQLLAMLLAEAAGVDGPEAPNSRVARAFERRGDYCRVKGGLARASLSLATRKAVFERDGGICAYCTQPVEWADYHCDHVEAVSKGGSDAMGNLRASCRPCNLSKAAKPLSEWRQ